MQEHPIERKKKEREEHEQTLIELGNKLFEQEREKLPEYLDNKLKSLAENLASVNNDKDLNPLILYEWIKAPISANTPKYSTEELAMMFEYYTKTIAEINKRTKDPPTKPNFCLFCGITTQTYDTYLNGIDVRKRELMGQIDQYIRDMQLTLGETGGVNPIIAMYRSKSEHGMYEAQAPKTIQFESDIDYDRIKEQIRAVQSGESLSMKQGSDGVYRPENKNGGD